ncbi:hypothetical protein MRI28_03340 [Nocardiopsis dassonvillei]|uniref:hypothetical protein n=1 Tax=Nocardiopsis dassonvillei TaxID=2014 RepID=UPI00200C01DE|nr:hypothetical protein [Nocardiopsis dassonvillei]MCK9868694.1 hypothetical protein [Nocardiopsis dassonvillei]
MTEIGIIAGLVRDLLRDRHPNRRPGRAAAVVPLSPPAGWAPHPGQRTSAQVNLC